MAKKLKIFTVSLLISLGVGFLSAFFIRGNTDIYKNINTPPFSPPSVVFPIVWTLLYILMGISSAIIFQKIKINYNAVVTSLFIYALSLFLNFWWSIIFFNGKLYTFAFMWLLILILSIYITVKHYKSISKIAAYLQIPYLIWTFIAAYLNFGIIILN